MTSSNMSNIPFSAVSFLNSARKPSLGRTIPMLPAIGSRIQCRRRISLYSLIVARTASMSLYGTVKVNSARAEGTPGLAGIPKVAKP